MDVTGVDSKSIKDYFFDRENAAPTSKEAKFFGAGDYKSAEVSSSRKEAQKKIDGPLLENLKGKVEKKYLRARFSLTKNQKAHDLKF